MCAPFIFYSVSFVEMESGGPNNRTIDNILSWHHRRLQEASELAGTRMFFPAKRRAHIPIEGVTSTQKRAPTLTTEEAARTGMYKTVIPMLELFSVRSVSRKTGIPESTIRKARDRFNETGSISPRKRGRPTGTNRIFTDESLEGLQDFIDTHPESTLKNMQSYLSSTFGINPDISTISNVLKNMKITDNSASPS